MNGSLQLQYNCSVLYSLHFYFAFECLLPLLSYIAAVKMISLIACTVSFKLDQLDCSI